MQVARYVYLPPALDEKLRVTAFRRRRPINEIIVEAPRRLLET